MRELVRGRIQSILSTGNHVIERSDEVFPLLPNGPILLPASLRLILCDALVFIDELYFLETTMHLGIEDCRHVELLVRVV